MSSQMCTTKGIIDMSTKIDSLDLEIIKEPQRNARVSITRMSENIGSTRPTVTSGARRMVNEK